MQGESRAQSIRRMGAMVLYGDRGAPPERLQLLDRGYEQIFAAVVHVGEWIPDQLANTSCVCDARPCSCRGKYLQRHARPFGFASLRAALVLMCARPGRFASGPRGAQWCVSGVTMFHFDFWVNAANWAQNNRLDLTRGWLPMSSTQRRENALEIGLLNMSFVTGCHWLQQPDGPNGTAAFIDHKGAPRAITWRLVILHLPSPVHTPRRSTCLHHARDGRNAPPGQHAHVHSLQGTGRLATPLRVQSQLITATISLHAITKDGGPDLLWLHWLV